MSKYDLCCDGRTSFDYVITIYDHCVGLYCVCSLHEYTVLSLDSSLLSRSTMQVVVKLSLVLIFRMDYIIYMYSIDIYLLFYCTFYFIMITFQVQLATGLTCICDNVHS